MAGGGADRDGWTALHFAALEGDDAQLSGRLDAGDNPNAKTTRMCSSTTTTLPRPDGATLYLSVDKPELGPDRVFDKGVSPLAVALVMGHHSCAELLLDNRTKPGLVDGVGATPLHHAALSGLGSVATRLIHAGVDIDKATKVRRSVRFADSGTTALHCAFESGVMEIIDSLLDAGADPAIRTSTGLSVLYFASRSGNVQAVDAAAVAGADPTEQGVYSNFPLVEAVARGSLPVVRRLLELGAVTEEPQGAQAPLRLAIELGQDDIVDTLLAGGARPIEHLRIHFAASGNDLRAVVRFLDGGTDVDERWEGETPLMSCSVSGSVRVAQLLLDRGADLDAVSHNGTALHCALANGKSDIARLLIARGADPNIQNEHGNTALWVAAFRHDIGRDIVDLLLANGADPTIPNKAGRTPGEFLRN